MSSNHDIDHELEQLPTLGVLCAECSAPAVQEIDREEYICTNTCAGYVQVERPLQWIAWCGGTVFGFMAQAGHERDAAIWHLNNHGEYDLNTLHIQRVEPDEYGLILWLTG